MTHMVHFDPKMHEAMFHLQRDPKFSKLMISSPLPVPSTPHPKPSKVTPTRPIMADSKSPKLTSGSYLQPRPLPDDYLGLNVRTISFYRERNAHLEVMNGCRIYRTATSDTHKTADVFVNYIPMNVFEQELVQLFEQAGQVETLRLVMHETLLDHSRGFCFITFLNKEDAFRAIEMFDNRELHGKFLSVQHCITNSILYIKQIPRSLTQQELFDTFTRFAPNLVNVILPQCSFSPGSSPASRNRGFCFLHYATYDSAKVAKELFAQHRFQPWGSPLQVLWANPLNLAKTRTLFVRNIPAYADEQAIAARFAQCGRVERVIRKRDYVFVHYVKYEDALVAIDTLHGKPFFPTSGELPPESKMVVTLARTDRKQSKFVQNSSKNPRQQEALHQYHQAPQQATSYPGIPYPVYQNNQNILTNHSPVARVTVGIYDTSSIGTDPGTSMSSTESLTPIECCSHCHGHSHVQYYPVLGVPGTLPVPGTTYPANSTWPYMQMYSDWCYFPVASNADGQLLDGSNYLDLV